ncbi:HlyD family type I secretion periplasmic adaptor subunit [Xanthobacter autotrophicus]|uniref:HlyD family type I secretion periplasmic adaptor subunit n=1 Tax=Xanthobacter autotrophicus TaxID=280 RepID=UPI0024A6AA4E|nr:HlyD family type I secretion periplasmic adaptor subunit [Xanthobacter autotrophicus]MDI4657457.1 HlyD family type I secretion periplasmic adaptor subunit [Xanthobacter autotrophicus]
MLRLLRNSPREADDAAGGNTLPLAVLEFESPSATIIATRVPTLSRAINLFVFLLVVSLLVASGLVRIDKVVSASGKLVADAPNILLQPFDQTIVESINARKGDIVRKGQVLARLNPTFSSADAVAIKDQVDLLTAKAARLKAEAAGTIYLPDMTNPHAELQASIFRQRQSGNSFSLQNFDQKINELTTQIAGNNSQAAYFVERLDLAVKVEGMRQKLEDLKVGSLLNTLLAQDTRLTMAASLSQAKSDAAQAGRKLAAQQAEREAFVQHWNSETSQELADTRRRLVQAQQDFAKADLHHELVALIAPRDAIVLSVAKISVGSVVTSAEPLIYLVPLDARLSVEADISGIDSGYVRPGDQVTIKFDTLPYLQYGSARGSVSAISADSFSPETTVQEGGSALPNRPRSLYYKGDIVIDELSMHDTPPGFRLMPGMPVTADIKVGTRSVLSYFVTKILPVAYDSMREP